MIQLHANPVVWRSGAVAPLQNGEQASREKTIAYQILRAHDKGGAADKMCS